MKVQFFKKLFALCLSASVVMASSGAVIADGTEETIPQESATESEEVVPESEESTEEGEEIIEDVQECLITDEAADAAAGIAIDATNFPDPEFRQLLSDQFDSNSNLSLSQSEIDNITEIGVGPYYTYPQGRKYTNVRDLTGIEYFGNLVTLYCNVCELTSIDVSHNTSLRYLSCDGNNLTVLDVSVNTELQELSCTNNNLTSLDLSNNPNLTTLECSENNIGRLDMSNNRNLENLYCVSCNLTYLNVSQCSSLESLSCEYNHLSSVILNPDCIIVRGLEGDSQFVYNGLRYDSEPIVEQGLIIYLSPLVSDPGLMPTYLVYDIDTAVYCHVQDMYRLYNPNSGEHFYTANAGERDLLASLGWHDEGIGWIAPATSNTPVYRLYNENGGEHHYTTSVAERDMLVSLGWNDEGIGWYSDDAQTVPLYRQYNPNSFANNHNYTTSLGENDWLVSIGWRAEGIGWYGVG